MKKKRGDDSGVRGVVVDLEWDPALPKEDILCIGYGAESFRTRVLRPELVPEEDRKLIEHGAFLIEHGNSDAIKLLDHGWDVGPVANMMVMAWLLNENQPLDLESLVWKYLQRKMDKRLLRTKGRVLFRKNNGKYVPIYRAPRAQLHAYCRRDVDDEKDLFIELRERLKAVNLLDYFRDEEMPYTRTLIDMERMGLPVDLSASEKLRKKLEEEHDVLDAELHQDMDLPEVFNLGSDDQVASLLFGDEVRIKGKIKKLDDSGLRIEIPEKFHPDEDGEKRVYIHGEWRFSGMGLKHGFLSEKTGKPSVSRRALLLNPATFEVPWVLKFLEWRKIDKLLTTYLRVFPRVAIQTFSYDMIEETRIRSHYNQTGTKTGRLSSSDINLQNIPARGERGKLIRGLFKTHPHLPFLMGDFSQLETRLMAHFSQDPYLVKIFEEGRDPFIEMATDIYGREITKEDPERGATKNVWYANGYGAMPDKMHEMILLDGGEMNLKEVIDLYDEMQKLLSVYFEWRDWLIEQAKDKGYVKTIGGRKRRIRFNRQMSWKQEMHGERAAANAKVQGSAADYVRKAMVTFGPSPACALCAQVHDELIYQYRWRVNPEQQEHERRLLKKVCESGLGFGLTVPMVFDAKIATSWGDK